MPVRRRTRSLACKVKSTQASHHRSTGTIRHSLRNGFNGFFRALPGEPGFLATIPAQCEALSRVDASVGASGPHDFAVRLRAVRLLALVRPPHLYPAFVTIASRPSHRVRRASLSH
jgi:hypothetical protein